MSLSFALEDKSKRGTGNEAGTMHSGDERGCKSNQCMIFFQNPEGSVQVEDGQNEVLEFCKQEKFDYKKTCLSRKPICL